MVEPPDPLEAPSGDDQRTLLWRAAVHEAGHVAADHLHGFCPVEVTIDPATQALGSGNTFCRDRQATRATAELYVVSCMAGSEAERALGADDQMTRDGAGSDLKKALSVLMACPRDLTFYTDQARTLVRDERHSRAIQRLAKTIYDSKRIVGRELQLAIDAAYELPGAEDRLVKFRTHGESWDLGICRWYGAPTYRPPRFLTDVVFDALLEVDRTDGEIISARPQRDDDFERLSSPDLPSELLVEFPDESRDPIYLRRIALVDRVVQLHSLEAA